MISNLSDLIGVRFCFLSPAGSALSIDPGFSLTVIEPFAYNHSRLFSKQRIDKSTGRISNAMSSKAPSR